jgi:hypothetical protein
MESTVAQFNIDPLWLVTAIPMNTDADIGIVSCPIAVHAPPSVETELVNTSPLRLSFTQ